MTNDEILLATIFHITLLKADFRCGHVESQTFGYLCSSVGVRVFRNIRVVFLRVRDMRK